MDSRKLEIMTTLVRLSHTIEAGLTRHLSPFGIAFTDLRLMLMILVLQGVSQKELAAQMGVSQVVVSTRLDKLERAGLVTRSHVGHRRVSVRHTETGTDLLHFLLHSVYHSAPGRAMEPLTLKQADNVLDSVRVLVSSMRVLPEEFQGAPVLAIPANLPEVIGDRLGQGPEEFENQVIKEQEWMNRALQSLEKEIEILVQAFRLLVEGRNQPGSIELTRGSGADGDD